jgi:hypothetical protein
MQQMRQINKIKGRASMPHPTDAKYGKDRLIFFADRRDLLVFAVHFP